MAQQATSVATKKSRRASRHPAADDAMIDLLYRQPLQKIDFAEKYWRKYGIGCLPAFPLALTAQLAFAPVPSELAIGFP